MASQQNTIIDSRMMRLCDAGFFGKWVVDTNSVNIEDLLNCRQGAIVRCTGNVNDAVKFISGDTLGIEGCIAGWISEDEETTLVLGGLNG